MAPSVAGVEGQKLRLTFYGDDFTGSTDAMEGLALAGVRTVLFMEPPDERDLARFPGLGAVGVAGISRAMSPDWMDRELPGVFMALKALGSPIFHYKVCSTFDSSPSVGSIGRALEIGQRVFAPRFVPVVVGLPRLERYCAFGNLFARSGLDSAVFRLDRHPTMRTHPSTPMDESDLRIHLSRQTRRSVALFDVTDLEAPPEIQRERLDSILAERPDAVLFDVMRDGHLAAIGRLIEAHVRREAPMFAVGSSAVEHALTAHWRDEGAVDRGPAFAPRKAPEAVDQVLVLSGSCSPVTARQIMYAVERGFADVALQTERMGDPASYAQETQRAAQAALAALRAGRSVIVHTCLGPEDARREATARSLLGRTDQATLLGGALVKVLSAALRGANLHRVIVAGGDTSGQVVRGMGLRALEMVAPTTPGAPLCRVYGAGAEDLLDGLDLVLKGGQVGQDSYLVDVLGGGENPGS